MKQYISKAHWTIDEPLTVITYGELTFCLEHRTVEICGRKIDLTTKEFDIVALLILNPKRVFTYDMITDRVWHEKYDFYSRKTGVTFATPVSPEFYLLPYDPPH